MVKFPIIDFDLRKMDPPTEESPKKKAKPVMIDAWTQTERSDYALIKSRLNGTSLSKEPGLYQQLMIQKQQNKDSRFKSHSTKPNPQK
jgi:hypothetical protein